MATKIKKSTACSFGNHDSAVMQAATDVLKDLETLSNEARWMMDENPESKGSITLWNCLVDIEDTLTTLSEGSSLPEDELITLGNTCVEATQLFNRSEEISQRDVIAVFKKLNGIIFNNEYFK